MPRLLSFADARFFPLVIRLAKNTRRFSGYKFFLYDLGLTDEQKHALELVDVVIERTDFPADTFEYNQKTNIKTTHKIYCIEHFLRKYSESVVVLDADTLIMESISELWPSQDAMLVVTGRCPREQKPHFIENGKINAGVMAFGPGLPEAFFQEWKRLCAEEDHTDQSALSLMLDRENIEFGLFDVPQNFMNFAVVVREGAVYNDVTCRVGKIFHVKSVGRRASKMFFYKLFFAVSELLPNMVSGLVRLNRKHAFYIWKSRGKSTASCTMMR